MGRLEKKRNTYQQKIIKLQQEYSRVEQEYKDYMGLYHKNADMYIEGYGEGQNFGKIQNTIKSKMDKCKRRCATLQEEIYNYNRKLQELG